MGHTVPTELICSLDPQTSELTLFGDGDCEELIKVKQGQ